MTTSIEQHIKDNLPNYGTYLLATSGGLDSMVLLYAMHKLKYKIAVAHCNYNLRGEHSQLDQALVENYCKANAIPFYVKQFDTKQKMQDLGASLQDTARQLRYAFFEELMQQHQYQWLCTAHHANDNVETILMRLGRGTGLSGLQGIPAKNKQIRRPLLAFTKQHLEAYAHENNVVWRLDESNLSNNYLRNAVRNELIPQWEKLQPDFMSNMIDNIGRWQAAHALYKQGADKLRSKFVRIDADGDAHILVKQLGHPHAEVVMFEILQDYNASPGQVSEVLKLQKSNVGASVDLPLHKVLRHGTEIIITKNIAADASIHYLHSPGDMVQFELGRLHCETFSSTDKKPSDSKSDSNIEMLDAAKLEWPLCLRVKREGDYFYPLGMRKKKKISRFLIDKKIPLHKKQHVWLLTSGNKIVWVVGHRIDDRFKIQEHTQEILQINFTAA
ncbi:MAG: hypothetical protein RL660_21 [Bacteroidota bacterium]|jgi:tRNA(Ile)-lysidine synthase